MSVRVVVVDDSVVIRRLVVQVLESDPDFEVVGTAANGRIALTKIEQLRPDVITMDVEMPDMDGIQTVRELRKRGIRTPIIMFSTLTERGATATLDALSAGASDYVAKPANMGSVTESLNAVAEQLIPKIRGLLPGRVTARFTAQGAAQSASGPAGSAASTFGASALFQQSKAVVRTDQRRHPIKAVIIGSSTGGPEALSKLVAALTEPLPVPVFIAQHMPALFTKQLAARLDRLGPHTVTEAVDGEIARPGTIYIAPGDWHLTLSASTGNVRCALNQKPPVNFCRPSVDVLFQSAADIYKGALLSVVLTGMGADGKVGCGRIVDEGGTVVVQDQATSVVWGMPGAVATAGYAHRIVPLTEVATTIKGIVQAATAGAVTTMKRGE
ncbi:protein-glutamate methylesterase/protein-glutamine glutaminase [Timonella sp. A28]|uniref:protein-glutamate methylesterase/protein-glutamine glutaminase n=1 Tax=Timonella sp. A28 TaxID=3442640 RepID=UPI003EBC1724